VKRLFLFFILNLATYGQTRAPAYAHPDGLPPGPVQVSAEIEPQVYVTDVDLLVRMADLIVEATVKSVLPAVIVSNNGRTPLIETQSVLSVSTLLFGTLPPGSQEILLTQIGGQVGRWNIVSNDAPLVQAGEYYIMFLEADTRSTPPNVTGLPRYDVCGVWGGLVKVVEGKTQYLASAAPKLHESDGKDADAFITSLRADQALKRERHHHEVDGWIRTLAMLL
jgi:hypothetical protein